MAEQRPGRGNTPGRCMVHNWWEERCVAALDGDKTKKEIQTHGHSGILTMDQDARMESVTTMRASYTTSKSPRVKVKGMYLAQRHQKTAFRKNITQMIRDQFHAEADPPTPKTDFCSTTHRDFCAPGFVPLTPKTTQPHDYKTDQAITFWSENYRQIPGVTAVQTPNAPFRKSALFSTPISERLDEIEPPLDS